MSKSRFKSSLFAGNRSKNVVQPVFASPASTLFGLLCTCKGCALDYNKKDTLNIQDVGTVCLNCVTDLVKEVLG